MVVEWSRASSFIFPQHDGKSVVQTPHLAISFSAKIKMNLSSENFMTSANREINMHDVEPVLNE